MAQTYKIASGDNLTKIAKANNTTVAALMAANPQITNANVIQAGATINIPSTSQQGGSYTYQNKSYAIGTGPYPSGQVPSTTTPQTVYNNPSMVTQPYQTPSNSQNPPTPPTPPTPTPPTPPTPTPPTPPTPTPPTPPTPTPPATTTPTGLAWNATYAAFGVTQDSWNQMSATQQMLFQVAHSSQLSAYGQSATAQPVQTYINQAANDPTLLATYGDALNLDTQTLQQGIQNIQSQMNVTAQGQQIQMQQAQAGLEKTFGGQGTAYSSFREGAQQQLNTQNQGIITSTAQQLQNQLNQAASGYEATYGSAAAQGQNLSATYLNPLTGQNQTYQGQVLSGITGTQPLAKQQAINTEASNSIKLDQPATTYNLNS